MSQVLATTRGTKKTAEATCVCVGDNSGEVRINKVPLEVHTDKLLVSKYEEILIVVGPDLIAGLGVDLTNKKMAAHVVNRER